MKGEALSKAIEEWLMVMYVRACVYFGFPQKYPPSEVILFEVLDIDIYII